MAAALSIRTRSRQALEPVGVLLLAICAWESAVRMRILVDTVPAPTSIAAETIRDLSTSEIWRELAVTGIAWGLGLSLVVVTAIPLGLLLGANASVYTLFNATANFFRMLPMIAALPLLIFVAGVGLRFQLYLVLLTAIWPILIQTMYGVHDVDPMSVQAARAYGIKGWRLFAQIIVPSAGPHIATGLRLSAIVALLAAVAASLIAGGGGLGRAISMAAQGADPALMYARTALAGVLGLAVTGAFTALEGRTLRWHSAHRQGR